MKNISIWFLLMGFFFIFSCNTTPHEEYDKFGSGEDKCTDLINKIEKYNKLLETNNNINAKKKERNKILDEISKEIYLRYERFEKRLLADTAEIPKEDVLTTKFTVKEIISKLRKELKGIDKTPFSNDTNKYLSKILTAQMRYSMAKKYIELENSMKKELYEYPLELGLTDIIRYCDSGTIIGALQDIDKEHDKTTIDLIKEAKFINEKKEQTVDILKIVYFSNISQPEKQAFDNTAREISGTDFSCFIDASPNIVQVIEFKIKLEAKSGTVTTMIAKEMGIVK